MQGAGVTMIEFGDVLQTERRKLVEGLQGQLQEVRGLVKEAGGDSPAKSRCSDRSTFFPWTPSVFPWTSGRKASLTIYVRRPLRGTGRCHSRCDGETFSKLDEAAEKVSELAQEKPFVTLLIEQAKGPIQKAQVRQILMTYKAIQGKADPLMAPDVIDICKAATG
ncbi:unnamed protein product [Bursaphelenchus okinawaensis]|uniref:Uncharacterized protein n=1 Tax=Bursaphelenchus okinawaensis TaxID=465554 RepID=A0A811LN14_9BILA|nr:unnamed protein product [Bursaphelenchus okinawaensis]CAG9127158.1 unnamed protein product [Bursaphelenchus okinawaensis]